MSGSYALASNLERPASVSSHSASGVESADELRLQQVVERLTGMGNAAFVAHPLPGGLTNHNYRVDTAGGRTMVVRLSSPQSSVLTIAREDEYLNSRAAAAAGVAPPVLGYLPELSALVLDWIEGQTFDASDLDDSGTLRQVAAMCRQLHAGPRFATDFDMFALTRRYLDVVLDNGYRLPEGYLTYRPQMHAIEQAMAQSPQPSVPCHNDLLPANMMSGGGRLWFIDFEYAGNGDPCFELGNLCSEAHLNTARLEELIAAYYGAPSPDKVARARLHALMSNYGWTLWACIQAATSELDFDFWDWGLEKFERAVAQFRGPDLPALLSDLVSDVQQP